MQNERLGIKHPRSLSVREDHLLPTIDGWLGQLFDDDHVDDTIETMAAIDLENTGSIEESEARRIIKDCDKRIAILRSRAGPALILTGSRVSLAGLQALVSDAKALRLVFVVPQQGAV